MNKFPIVLTVYNRPYHVECTLDSLLKCDGLSNFKLYIFSDGPKDKNQIKKVNQVRKLIQKYKNKMSISIINRKENFGLLKNITESLDFIFSKFDKAIVIEDDLIFDKKFLKFMKKSIIKYQKSKKILQVSGYSYPLENIKNPYFAKLSSCWGWAICSDKWVKFRKFLKNRNDQLDEYIKIKESKKLKYLFNYNGSFNYLSMLRNHFNNKVNSWGIIFYLYLFKTNSFCFFPPRSFIKNIGFDGTGNHNSKSNLFNSNKSSDLSFKYPKKVYSSNKVKQEIKIFFKKDLSIIGKLKKRIYEKFF